MQGFGPFREETEVDFADVDLVGLVGPTGSGKSTILDAMTFALFGRIARLDARVVAPVINALSQEARISFEFELEGQTYTAVRVVRRQGDGASTKEARLERAGESLAAKKDEVDEQVELLLGMNFDRFTKVVFLPQGKFSAFLHDKPVDRQRLLRMLLGLGLYEHLGKRAREIKATASAQLDVLRPKLDEANVSDAQIQGLADRARAVTGLHTRAAAQLTERSMVSSQLAQARRNADDYAVLALAVDSLRVPTAVVELGSALEAATQAVAAARVDVTTANNALVKATSAAAAGPDQAEVKRLVAMRADLARLGPHIAALTKRVDAATSANDHAIAAAAELTSTMHAAQEHTTSAETAERAAVAAAAQPPSRSSIERDLAAHAQLEKLTERNRAAAPLIVQAVALSQEAAQGLADAQAELAAAQVELREAETASHADVLIGLLVVGDQCPVCAQLVTELPSHVGSAEIDTARSRVDAANQTVEVARTFDAETGRSLAILESTRAALTRDLDTATKAASLLASAPQLQSTLLQIDTSDALVADAKEAAEQARQSERTLRESDNARQITQLVTSTTAALATARAELTGSQDRSDQIREQLGDAPSQADLDTQLELVLQLSASERTAGEHAQVAATALDATRRALVAVEDQQENLRRAFSNERDRFVGIDPPQPLHTSVLADWQALVAWASGLCAPLLEQHTAAGASAADLTVALQAHDDEICELHEQALAAMGTPTDSTAEAMAATSAPAVDPDTTVALLIRLVATAESAVSNARERQARLAQDRAQVAALEEVEQVHQLLGTQLRSSGFEQWLLDEVVESLVEHASERLLELSRGQYSIEIDGMVFQIRDHHNGDELRDARTLSGGETFLASLALALALADSIAEMAPTGTASIDCLFLDEGFGTLDPETLDVVAAAIEELGAAGRMVGVVTHIRDLAERMPVRFEVTKHATTSVVEKVFS